MQGSVAELELHRAALTGHCYRMLGSAVDADDAVQETIIRAWRALDSFDGRASLRTWMYRIATNVCLDAISEQKRRFRPMEQGPSNTVHDPLIKRTRSHWLEPIPDVQVLPDDSNPAEIAVLRQSIRLAFVAALQHLPPKQRAVLLLVEVLGWSAGEVAESLGMTTAAVNSALQRSRTTMATRNVADPAPLTSSQAQLVERYVEAFQRYDVDELTSLLREDATFSMPPYALWLQGPQAVREWLTGRGNGCRGSKLIPVGACGLPAFAQYRQQADGSYHAFALVVLELAGDHISGWNSFLDVETIFPRFGLGLYLA